MLEIQFSSCLNKLLQVYYSGIIYSTGKKRNENEAEARNNETEHTVPPNSSAGGFNLRLTKQE